MTPRYRASPSRPSAACPLPSELLCSRAWKKNDPLLDPDMRKFLHKELGNGYESRIRSLCDKYGISTEEAIGVIIREQMAKRD